MVFNCQTMSCLTEKSFDVKKKLDSTVTKVFQTSLINSKTSQAVQTKNVLQNHNSKQFKSKRADNPSARL